MHLGKERAIGFVEDDVQVTGAADTHLAADMTAAEDFGAAAAQGPALEQATATAG